MIEEKVSSDENILAEDSNIENNNDVVDSGIERNYFNKEDKHPQYYHKIHLREIFHKSRGKYIFPDRG